MSAAFQASDHSWADSTIVNDTPSSFTTTWGFKEELDGYGQMVTGVEESLSMTSTPAGLVSDQTKALLDKMVNTWLCSVLSYLGVVDNIITIIVFARQGYQDTINISMTSLSVWELVRCVSSCLFRVRVGTYRAVMGNPSNYLFFLSGYVSCALAAYVAVERCLCVSKPFTVRFLLTPRVVAVVNLLVSLVVFGSVAIIFFQYNIKIFVDPVSNRTVIRRIPTSLYHPDVVTYYNVVSIAWPLISFTVICVCTGVIAYHLGKASGFRVKATSRERGDGSVDAPSRPIGGQMTSRDKKVIKMLLVILVVYIVNLLPRLARYFVKLTVPEFKYRGRYNNVFFVVTYFMHMVDLINASINPFIFYAMSAKFRSTLTDMFCPKNDNRKGKS